MEPCPHSVGRCDVMRTCPCCKRVLRHRAGMVNHRKACTVEVDVDFAQYQHQHWKDNHDRRAERARRRMNRR